MIKIHRHLVEQSLGALEEIFSERAHADKVIEKHLKAHKKWGSRDRKFFAESVYEIVRWRRALEFLSGSTDLWRIWGVHWLRLGNTLPDWPEFDGLNLNAVKKREGEMPSAAVRESFPDELYQRGREELGGEWDAVAHALNKPAEVFLRVNTLRGFPEEVIKLLEKDGVQARSISKEMPGTLRLLERKNVFKTDAFQKGFFEVQDAASQRVAPLLEVEPGHRVIDACAGGGGKTLHLAALMKNKGKIIAMDIHDWKLNQLKVRARRGGVDIVETRVIESSKTIKRLAESADRVLLDVPCSGSGVLRRNPDAKWKLSNEEIDRLQVLQQEILSGYSVMTKKGGQMVYATCSLFPSENEKQVEKFLSTHPTWKLLRQIVLRPDREGFDGFYGALLQRT